MPRVAVRLYDSKIRALKPTDCRQQFCDGDRLYFVLGPKKPHGQPPMRAWEYRYVSPVTGRASSVMLGRFPLMGVSDARKARDGQAALVARGLDPAAERRRERSTERVTFEGTVRAWDAWRAGRVGASTRRLAMGRFERFMFPALGRRPLASLTTPDLAGALDAVARAGKHETVKRLRADTAALFNWAIASGSAATNPADALRGLYEGRAHRHHSAVVDPEAFGGLLIALDGYGGQAVTCKALRLLPLVFVRSSELREARWDEFDLDASTWTIPAHRMKRKENGDHIVPLSTQAVAILRELHELTGHGNRVFPGLGSGKALSDTALRLALRSMGYAGIHTLHGFRATATTLLNAIASDEGGRRFNFEHVEMQMAHRPSDRVRDAYMRATFLEQRRAMMQAWADECDRMRELARSNAAAA